MDLTPPHGGTLKRLTATDRDAERLKAEAMELPTWRLEPRQVHDLELLLNGGFSPLEGYMGREDHAAVCSRMRLEDGTLWPMPITLDVPEDFAATIPEGGRVALRHPEGIVLAVLNVSDVWQPDKKAEAEGVFGTTDDQHPGVFRLLHEAHSHYVGGRLEGVERPPHHTHRDLHKTPAQVREAFNERGWDRVVGFQTRNPLHRVHVELTKRAADRAGANLLIHPAVGRTKPGDVSPYHRVRCYQEVLKHYPEDRTMLSLLPLHMRMAGPREALWHAIIRKNFGCTHFVVGRDHAGVKNQRGEHYYDPAAARELVEDHEDELGMEVVTFEELVYVEDKDAYIPKSQVPEGASTLRLSGTQLRQRLREGREIPPWFSYPEVIQQLRKVYPPRSEQGFTVFFTGLSASGKSTVANVLVAKLMEDGNRPVTLLDGDIVRQHLSSELGFSKAHRDLNIRRIGFVASEITKNGGAAVCAPIAPYDAVRREVRDMVEAGGGFVLVHVATPLEVCEKRDPKGLYQQARQGDITNFTGVNDPYEAPKDAEVTVDTSTQSPEEAATRILDHLKDEGYVQ